VAFSQFQQLPNIIQHIQIQQFSLIRREALGQAPRLKAMLAKLHRITGQE
jgi:hypothetical protein